MTPVVSYTMMGSTTCSSSTTPAALLPVREILAGGMAPGEIPPFNAAGVVLEEQVVDPIKALAVGILAGIANAFNYDQPYRGQYHFSPQENCTGCSSQCVRSLLVAWPQERFPHSMPPGLYWKNSVDVKNTSGFGKNGKTPIVAMYTSFVRQSHWKIIPSLVTGLEASYVVQVIPSSRL
jgi:hypothetical protein